MQEVCEVLVHCVIIKSACLFLCIEDVRRAEHLLGRLNQIPVLSLRVDHLLLLNLRHKLDPTVIPVCLLFHHRPEFSRKPLRQLDIERMEKAPDLKFIIINLILILLNLFEIPVHDIRCLEHLDLTIEVREDLEVPVHDFAHRFRPDLFWLFRLPWILLPPNFKPHHLMKNITSNAVKGPQWVLCEVMHGIDLRNPNQAVVLNHRYRALGDLLRWLEEQAEGPVARDLVELVDNERGASEKAGGVAVVPTEMANVGNP